MGEDPNTNSAYMAKTPTEVISIILSLLPDRKSLLNTIVTCKDVYKAYDTRKTYIESCILFDSMHESVYQEAVVYYHVEREQWRGARAGVQAIHRVFAKERTLEEDKLPVAQRIDLDEVKKIHFFHENVKWWANRITANLKINHPVLKGYNSPFRLTSAVMNRFKRAIYRLYMYINIMEKTIASSCADNGGNNRRVTPAEQAGAAQWCLFLVQLEKYHIVKEFCSHYSTAEVEQMDNVCEMLVSEIAPMLNCFIEDDIRMGALMPRFVNYAPLGMPMVVQGLKFMRDFVNARSYNQRFNLMEKVNSDDWIPYRSTRAGFPPGDRQLEYDVEHCGLTREDLKKMVNEPEPRWLSRVPFYDDGDIGPQWAWRKFNRRANHFGYDYHHTDYIARPWGYVFWDRRMLEAGGLMRINEDGTRDLMPIVRSSKIYQPFCAFEPWRSAEACQWVALAHYVKKALWHWGRVGWFDVQDFPSPHLMNQLRGINQQLLLTAQVEHRTLDVLFSYALRHHMHHPHNYLVAPGEGYFAVIERWLRELPE